MIEVFDAAAARRALANRALRCPDCGGALAPWGRARPRRVRDLGGGLRTVRPDRTRCTGCRSTHVVCEAGLLDHRAYTARVVGQALLAAAHGRGHRLIAAQLGAPEGTVRGWIRRAQRCAHQWWTVGVQAVVALDPDALPTRERADSLAYAIEALAAAALALGRRFARGQTGVWETIAVLTRGRLLAPVPAG